MKRQPSVPQTNSWPDDGFEDEILADLHAGREKHAAEHGFDPERITQDLISSFLKDHPDVKWADMHPVKRRTEPVPKGHVLDRKKPRVK